jgi:hypothetical protein
MKAWLALAVLVGCGTDAGTQWVDHFNPPPAEDGYTRFVSPTITDIEPGANVEWCQWVADAADVDRDVMDVKGYQSPTGHHAVLYATTATNFKVGESHECTVEDMLHIGFVGAIGGEGTGGDAAKLPEGLNFRLPKGQALMINTHWLNSLDNPVDGQAVIDVKFTPASSDHTIADLFANNGDLFQIDAGKTAAYDVNCVIQHDINLAMVTNHMHTYGTSAYSELVRQDGTKTMLVSDEQWLAEEQFNPKYQRFSVSTPMQAHAGDTFHTHCEWNNTTTTAKLFPDEMCAGVGFYFPGNGQITCENGGWGM